LFRIVRWQEVFVMCRQAYWGAQKNRPGDGPAVPEVTSWANRAYNSPISCARSMA
jgi:hypothetical protein